MKTNTGRFAVALICAMVTGSSVVAEEANALPAAATVRHRVPDVVYIPTPEDVVARMLRMAEVTKDDVVYDLGCGYGRIVIAAAKTYGCRAVGVDIDPRRVLDARQNVREHGLEKLVDIRQQDLFEVDLAEATVVTLYLNSRYNRRLVTVLNRMKSGSRVVSHLFHIEGIAPNKTVTVRSKHDRHEHRLLLWRTPLRTGDGGRQESHELPNEERQSRTGQMKVLQPRRGWSC